MKYVIMENNAKIHSPIIKGGILMDERKDNLDHAGDQDLKQAKPNLPLASLFLGPHAENARYWEDSFERIFGDYVYWRKNYYPKDGYMLDAQDMEKGDAFYRQYSVQQENMLNILKDNFPFFSPRYMAHMLSEQTLPAVMGYFATMLYNPNNVTEEAAPVTVAKELEFGRRVCKMLGYSEKNGWAHLCSGGSAANLEALWVARQSQFYPLVLRDVCKHYRWKFQIKLPNATSAEEMVPLVSCTDRQLLHLKPNESMYMVAKLTEYVAKEYNLKIGQVMEKIQKVTDTSKYNIRTQGYGNVLARIKLKPVVFVPQSAHYSLKKTVNILGYGESSVRSIPTTEKFRIDVDALEKMIREVKDDEYIAAVVAVFGTTEEGAVDPVHRVKWLRDSLARELNISFWFHVDAAWGGYFAVMKHSSMKEDVETGKRGRELRKAVEAQMMQTRQMTPEILKDSPEVFFERVDNFLRNVRVEERYTIAYTEEIRNKGGRSTPDKYSKSRTATWSDREVFAAMFALPAADSITVDPHKMGYIPYPAGLVAFRNKRVLHLLEQKATYIGTDNKYINAGTDNEPVAVSFFRTNDNFDIKAIGTYTLEGSRPGAAAMSCWFASEVIPLDIEHHGKIVRTTVLNAKKFAQHLTQHSTATFMYIDRRLQVNAGLKSCENPFTIELLYDNIDTNLVCFFVRPAKWERNYEAKLGKRQMPAIEEDQSWTLEDLNRINYSIYEKLTISPSNPVDSRKTSLYQKFYVAYTKADAGMYSAASMENTLDKFGFSTADYEKNGLAVMRSTIMNPWYFHASHTAAHTDYFMEFLEELHYAARTVIDEEIAKRKGTRSNRK